MASTNLERELKRGCAELLILALLEDRANILAVLQDGILKAGKLAPRIEVPLPKRGG